MQSGLMSEQCHDFRKHKHRFSNDYLNNMAATQNIFGLAVLPNQSLIIA
jgi:hypothetical protein